MANKAASPPTENEIRKAREVADLTQADAAERIHSKRRTWEDWEAGRAKMHPGLFELFLIKTGQPTRR